MSLNLLVALVRVASLLVMVAGCALGLFLIIVGKGYKGSARSTESRVGLKAPVARAREA